MERVNYQQLYFLQDEILNIIFQDRTEFYLTGGTCLNRFYFEKRYSDDLDLFTNFSDTFSYSTKEIIHRISKNNYAVHKEVDSKDFIRVHVKANGIQLQLDFVNDRVKRFGTFRDHKGYKLDNCLNILSNKITAVMGRDNPKDIFDICLIADNMPIQWDTLLAQAKEKLHFQKEEFLYRMETFPITLLSKLRTTDEQFLNNIKYHLNNVVNKISAYG